MNLLVRNSALLVALVAASPAAIAQTTTITTTTETRGPVQLSPEQRTTVYRSVIRERRVSPGTVVRPGPVVRYEIGAPITKDVELYDFPADTYVEVPTLKRYRYVYVNNQLVLVDPETSQVVDIITE